jgi:4-hydroxybenzoate polyprenyltransferase
MLAREPFAKILPLVRLTRPQNGLAVALGFLVGAALSNNLGAADLFAGIAIMLMIHSAATVQNDLNDIAVDRANDRQTGLLSGLIKVRQVNWLVLWLYVAAGALALLAPNWFVHLAAIGWFAGLAWAYNAKPLQLSRQPVLSIIVMGLCYGVTPLVYGYLLGGEAMAGWFGALAAFWFLRRSSISILKDYKDAKGDKRHDKRTFYLAFGPRVTALTSVLLAFAGYAGLVAVLWPRLGEWPLLFILPGLLMLLNLWRHLRLLSTDDEQQLNILFHRSFAGENKFQMLLIVCLLLSYN